MTYRKIAQLAGVSPSTVSKAMSGSTEISEETAERIRRIAEENGAARPKYRRNNSVARVAIIVPEIVSISYSQSASELSDELRLFDIEPSIYLCNFDDGRYCKIIDTLIEGGSVDGIISYDAFRYPHKIEIPMVCLVESNASFYDTICTDTTTYMFEVLEHLISLGHRRIGFISEHLTGRKLAGFRSAAAGLGLEINPNDIFISEKRFAAIGSEAAEYFIKQTERPSAIIAAYDEVALGAIHTFADHGIRVPDDISIVGINDIPISSYANVPLTTVRTYSSEIIRLAVKLLLDRMNNPKSHITQHIMISCKLVIRSTTAKNQKQ